MVVLACRNPRVATAVALAFGVCEEVVLGSIVWMLHTRGGLVSGAYLRADGLTAVFILNLGLVFVLVLGYAAGDLRSRQYRLDAAPPWSSRLRRLLACRRTHRRVHSQPGAGLRSRTRVRRRVPPPPAVGALLLATLVLCAFVSLPVYDAGRVSFGQLGSAVDCHGRDNAGVGAAGWLLQHRGGS